MSAASGTQKIVVTSEPVGDPMITAAIDNDTLTFNATENRLTCTNINATTFTGALSGNASSASLVDVNTFNTSPGDDKQYDIVLVDGSGSAQQLGRDAGLRYNPIDEILDVDNGVSSNGLRIGISSATEIDTTSENLYLDSAGGTVEILDNLTVRGDTILGNSKANDTITCTGVLFANRGQDASSTTTGSLRVTGGAGITQNLYVGKDIVAFYSSDINLKENLAVIPNALDKVGLITGYTYNWKSDTNYDYLNGNADTGVIAQDVEALGLPGITTTRDDGVKAVRYERLVPILIEAVKELTARVKALESS